MSDDRDNETETETTRGLEELVGQLADARRSDPNRTDEYSRWLKMYSEREWSVYNLERTGKKTRPRKQQKLAFNIVRSCVDGLSALLCEERSNIVYLTDDANWSLHKKARHRTKFVQGHFQTLGVHRLNHLVVKHAGIFGVGAYHVMREFGRITLEVCPPWEIVVNALSTVSCGPQQMFRTRMMDAHKLARLAPKFKEQILAAARVTDNGQYDPVEFVDEWTLPTGPGQGDGMHSQFIPGIGVLFDKEYKHDRFPIVTYFLDDGPVVWGGVGLPEQVEGIQHEINMVLETISNNVYHGGNIKVFIESASAGKLADTLSNALGCPVVEFTGEKPVVAVSDMGLPQLLGYLEFLEKKAFDLTGLNQRNVQSQPQPAAQSGRARLIENQSYSKRFATHQQRLEHFHRELADAILDAAEDLKDKKYTVTWAGSAFVEPITYADVGGRDDRMVCQPWTTSLAGETPSAKVAMIDQWLALGLIDLAGAFAVAQLPYDVAAHMNTILAPRELAEQMVFKIIEDGESVMPIPLMDLEHAATFSMLWYQRGYLNKERVGEDKLSKLLDFHNNCRAMQPPPMLPAGPQGQLPPEQASSMLGA